MWLTYESKYREMTGGHLMPLSLSCGLVHPGLELIFSHYCFSLCFSLASVSCAAL